MIRQVYSLVGVIGTGAAAHLLYSHRARRALSTISANSRRDDDESASLVELTHQASGASRDSQHGDARPSTAHVGPSRPDDERGSLLQQQTPAGPRRTALGGPFTPAVDADSR